MKKVYLSILSLVFVMAAVAQNTVNFPSNKVLNSNISNHAIKHNPSQAKSTNSRWYCYGETMNMVVGDVSELNANILFPDSTIQVQYSTGLGGAWIHKLGDVFDPSCTYFNDPAYHNEELSLLKNSSYTLDSLEFVCVYARGTKYPTAVDTMLIEISVNAFPGTYSYFGPTSAVSVNLGTDSTKFVDLAYKYSNNTFDYTNKVQFKVPLDAAFAVDTLDNGLNVIDIAPNITIPAGSHFYASYSFIPGYAWVPNVDSATKVNTFRFISYDENPGLFPVYTKRDWNVSYILPQDVRYNAAGGWNGSYIPSFAYMGGSSNTYSYVHHYVFYKCTGVSNYGYVGVNEVSAENPLQNAYPNPAMNGETVTIAYSSVDKNAVIEITDLVGNTIMTLSNLENNKVTFSTSDMASGMYYYTLKSGKQTYTKKFSVVK
jgi:hypothetical protein